MNLSICSISFRHQLISIDQLANWAKNNYFQGIELWGVHAKNLSDQPHYNKNWLAKYGLQVPMISDYLPLAIPDKEAFYKIQLLSRLAKHWGAKKIRTFAGEKGSAETSAVDRKKLVKRLKALCESVAEHNLTLIIETHPNTFADTLKSTQQLLDEVNHDSLKLNFDVLHVWESKINEIEALEQLKPHIDHFHFKNISSEELLNVFSPPNVYSASGSREGMTPLFEGKINFKAFIQYLIEHQEPRFSEIDVSLEWFGNHSQKILRHDRYLIQQIQQQSQQVAC
ncbi:MAG: sugar phosphate isomerase/epimerase family protein [Arenicella sp.]